MKHKTKCDWMKPKLLMLAAVAFVFTLSLYYTDRWSLQQANRISLVPATALASAADRWLRHYRLPLTGVVPATYIYDPDEEKLPLVLNTIGCKIPNLKVEFTRSISANLTAHAPAPCGERILSLHKLNGTHAQFVLDDAKWMNIIQSCTYRFVHRSEKPGKANTEIRYSPGVNFSTAVSFKLESDFMNVRCHPVPKYKGQIYDDAYPVVWRHDRESRRSGDGGSGENVAGKPWNVLLLGMDTMSRGRMLSTMHRTVAHFRHHRWIEFKGYHKIGDNTWPNLMALLTGMRRTTVDRACKGTMDVCNSNLIWSKYRDMGYFTAYAEDYYSLPDTFSTRGFTEQPTDHYMRPFFLSGERSVSNARISAVCTGAKTSGQHILDYATDFVQTYKDDSFFGFFWINSNSHNSANQPEAIEDKLTEMLEKLDKIGTLKNTFVFFLSDHGIRFGENRVSMPSYYEERLPIMFMWAPFAFRDQNREALANLLVNRQRLVTPYDLYVTLEDILRWSTGWNKSAGSEACPKCRGMFRAVPSERTCEDAAIDPKWCSCHTMEPMAKDDVNGLASVDVVLKHIQRLSSTIETKKCTECQVVHLKYITRMHYYKDLNETIKHMVVAFVVTPGDAAYEATVSYDGREYQIEGQLSIISSNFGKGYCAKNKSIAMYCFCKKIKKSKCKVK